MYPPLKVVPSRTRRGVGRGLKQVQQVQMRPGSVTARRVTSAWDGAQVRRRVYPRRRQSYDLRPPPRKYGWSRGRGGFLSCVGRTTSLCVSRERLQGVGPFTHRGHGKERHPCATSPPHSVSSVSRQGKVLPLGSYCSLRHGLLTATRVRVRDLSPDCSF